jgi:hypothetical protein
MTAFVSIPDSLHTFGSGSCQTRTTYSLIKSDNVQLSVSRDHLERESVK